MCHESSSEFGVPTAPRILKMSADDLKYKMAQKYGNKNVCSIKCKLAQPIRKQKLERISLK